MTPLPKMGFGPPLVRYVFHPPQVSVLCFSCTKIHDRADQKLFWRGPKILGRVRSLVRFPPPIRFPPPHITAQTTRKFRRLLVESENREGYNVTRQSTCANVHKSTRENYSGNGYAERQVAGSLCTGTARNGVQKNWPFRCYKATMGHTNITCLKHFYPIFFRILGRTPPAPRVCPAVSLAVSTAILGNSGLGAPRLGKWQPFASMCTPPLST